MLRVITCKTADGLVTIVGDYRRYIRGRGFDEHTGDVEGWIAAVKLKERRVQVIDRPIEGQPCGHSRVNGGARLDGGAAHRARMQVLLIRAAGLEPQMEPRRALLEHATDVQAGDGARLENAAAGQ